MARLLECKCTNAVDIINGCHVHDAISNTLALPHLSTFLLALQ